ncbi:argonaute-like protein [Ganoderma leucocontextum]|nr:argonaute-like protein [Ganoderma leucocontextum]
MPPRAAPGGGGPARGRGSRGGGPSTSGQGPSRGGPPPASARGSFRGRVTPAIRGTRVAPTTVGLPDSSAHITTIGVKRTAFGQSGRALTVWTNHFEVKIPEDEIYHYDVISPSEKTLPARLNMEILERLQTKVAPDVFTPRVVYDGRKNIFSPRQLPFPSGSQEFSLTLNDPASPGEGGQGGGGERARGPKVYKVKLTHVATINPEVLDRFLQGKQSHDNAVLTAITALNVVIRMEPTMRYPFNVRSFFTPRETAAIGGGIVLWRGYFQSVRPAIGRMLINVDISTAAMYKPGRAIDVALELLGMTQRGPLVMSPKHGFPERELIKLQRFLSGVRINVDIPGRPSTGRRPPRVIKKLTKAGANQLSFTMRDGKTITVAQYFDKTHNYQLKFPDIVCIEVGSGAIIPMECCTIPEGQIMRKQVPPEKTKDVLNFATKKPHERLQSIRAALGVLNYGQSEYVKQFGMQVSPNADVQSLQARILDPPTLMYGNQSRQPTITPRDGAWNMVDKKFYRPVTINRWVVVVYEREQRFNRDTAYDMVRNFLEQFAAVGIKCNEEDPVVVWERPTNIGASLQNAGKKVIEKHGNNGQGPDLMIVVLPESSADMYQSVKHFGDIIRGVATQCLRSSKCNRANKQYFANVCLKINPKMGGINTIPEARSVPVLTDPRNPTIVMGADVIHPAPGADGRPSFTALVGNVDSETAKYIADCRAQTSRQEMIDDLEAMATAHIAMYKRYRQAVEKKSPDPKRVIFYRDGVSEGQFQHVLDFELPQLKRALAANNVDAKITVIVVGKRHHVRFFPQRREDADKSGNCPAGTVNEFTPDALQALSFALCHVYARSTRSVSIPAPVYYADIVCARAKNHYNPEGNFDLTESGTQLESSDAKRQLEAFRANFMPLNEKTKRVMYFS